MFSTSHTYVFLVFLRFSDIDCTSVQLCNRSCSANSSCCDCLMSEFCDVTGALPRVGTLPTWGAPPSAPHSQKATKCPPNSGQQVRRATKHLNTGIIGKNRARRNCGAAQRPEGPTPHHVAGTAWPLLPTWVVQMWVALGGAAVLWYNHIMCRPHTTAALQRH